MHDHVGLGSPPQTDPFYFYLMHGFSFTPTHHVPPGGDDASLPFGNEVPYLKDSLCRGLEPGAEIYKKVPKALHFHRRFWTGK